MSQFIESRVSQATVRNLIALCRLGVERLQAEGWQEPYESRGSRTDLWGTGGEIPPGYSTFIIFNGGEILFTR